MKKISERILSWCNEPEQGAIDQALNIEKHPCLIGDLCLMPDTHQGYGMPIGGVAMLDKAICPNMVGVDIGCGMLAVKTSLTEISTEQLKAIMSIIRENVPLGFNHHIKDSDNEIFNKITWYATTICYQELKSAKKQLGTLGGGNHFIEIQKGSDGHIWFMIHTGSRNLGKKVADFYNKEAIGLCSIFKQNEVVKNELAFLPEETKQFTDYLREMNLCLEFAYENRKEIANQIKEAFLKVINCEFLNEHNIHHNYAAKETHKGKTGWVHRKGATFAGPNTIGIIPGSQGTCSYIVLGLGNVNSMMSCSHGAGRKMSRNKAEETLSLEAECELLNSKGIIHSIRTEKDLDEAPSAYKDIDVVMEEQKDLVEILVKLEPLAVIKG